MGNDSSWKDGPAYSIGSTAPEYVSRDIKNVCLGLTGSATCFENGPARGLDGDGENVCIHGDTTC